MKIIYGGGQISVLKAVVMIAGGLLAVWWFTGCTPEPEYIVKTQFVDRVVETQVALDPRLTKANPLPPTPLFKCTDAQKRRTVCTEDAIDYMEAYRKVAGDQRAQIKAIRDLQP